MNTQPRHPKCRALPVEPHPDIHFSAMIPRRGVKIKIFLSVVIPVVKTAFVPVSATREKPANAGAARLCVVSPHPIPDTATALPKQARYQLRYTRLLSFLSGWAYSPKPMSEPSGSPVAPSLALSGTPSVPLWNSFALFVSGTTFVFWDLCGIEFCILKVLPTGFTSNSGCFLPQRAAQKLRRINKEISAMTKKQQADLDDSQPAERRCLFDVLPFSSNACSFTRECNADFYN